MLKRVTQPVMEELDRRGMSRSVRKKLTIAKSDWEVFSERLWYNTNGLRCTLEVVRDTCVEGCGIAIEKATQFMSSSQSQKQEGNSDKVRASERRVPFHDYTLRHRNTEEERVQSYFDEVELSIQSLGHRVILPR